MSQGSIPILDLKPQYESLKGEIQTAIDRVLTSTSFIMGPDVKAFEDECARFLGVKHALGVNSGTDALVIGLKALGVLPGDEVITTPFSFFATAESISQVGAVPVFVDIDERTFNIDASQIEGAITPKTKAIMPVHIYGRACNMDELQRVASKHGLPLVEDCAQSFGATWKNKRTGTFGTFGAYSFFPSKNLGAYGDGGLIATNDDKVAETSRMLRVHGAKKKYYNELLGYNSRLDTLQAAVLRVKLPHLDQWNSERRRVATAYNKLLEGAPGVVIPEVSEGHVFHQYTIRIAGGKRDQVQKSLEDQGISTMIYYPIPQDQLAVYKGKYVKRPICDRVTGEILSLPIWPEMGQATIQRVADAVRECVSNPLPR